MAEVNVESSAIEDLVFAAWREFLPAARTESLDGNDDFFELGGYSLIALRIASRIKLTTNVDVRADSLYDFPRLSDFVDHVRAMAH